MASPSLKNSGLEITSNLFLFFLKFNIFSILSPVMTGTVDFVTIILNLLINLLISLAAWNTFLRSAEELFFNVGVPTQIKIMSELFTAVSKSHVNFILPEE